MYVQESLVAPRAHLDCAACEVKFGPVILPPVTPGVVPGDPPRTRASPNRTSLINLYLGKQGVLFLYRLLAAWRPGAPDCFCNQNHPSVTGPASRREIGRISGGRRRSVPESSESSAVNWLPVNAFELIAAPPIWHSIEKRAVQFHSRVNPSRFGFSHLFLALPSPLQW